ncbi:aminodeoxychorismate synthase component I [Streptomyces sp. NPDC049627]|uniref:aminodeoxychorismate synthase component I n=1 Tax=Streptomyces sp. NPDC049627 TaxID=3365595 RepID=UPI00379F11C2
MNLKHGLRLVHVQTQCALPAAAVFEEFYGSSPDAYWLDSSRCVRGARYSFMGDASGPLADVITYRHGSQQVESRNHGPIDTSIWEYLSRRTGVDLEQETELPFDFNGGFVGYFGYELKAECGGSDRYRSRYPDAAFIFSDRFLAFDHEEGRVHVCAVTDQAHLASARAWAEETSRRVAAVSEPARRPTRAAASAPGPLVLRHDKDAYRALIGRAQELIRAGETYEVCLTTSLTGEPVDDPLALYMELRRINPAPYAAYFALGDIQVLCSSPERFLKLDRDRRVETKPIKGTIQRGATPEEDRALAEWLRGDEKTQAENMMIVDLLRNDLGRVCEVGTVKVDSLMHVESYETVHQLVSTISGTLAEGTDAVECVRASFPGGSMTGAPKIRTMSFIDELEGAPRGIYSGSLGYLALNGTADLNIVIRTVVNDPAGVHVGAGGAIVHMSDPDDEFAEVALKLEPLERALNDAPVTLRNGHA